MEPDHDPKIAVDEFRHIIHVMDIHKGTEDLTDAIPRLGHSLFHDAQPEGGWSWFLYDKDGTVCDYRDDHYYFVPLTDERIYPAFIGDMLKCSNQIWMEQGH